MELSYSWKSLLEDEIQKPYFVNLKAFIEQERKTFAIYPEDKDVLAAFEACPLEKVQVVIVGQDPYHGKGQAHGLAFSVPQGVGIPPSLKNIYKELSSDLGIEKPLTGNLEGWAKRGVLLLNTTLTVREGLPLSHAGQGWEEFTSAVLRKLYHLERPLVFLLWGKSAQSKFEQAIEGLSASHHLVLKAAHPSPFSAKKFLGCRHFSKTKDFLNNDPFIVG